MTQDCGGIGTVVLEPNDKSHTVTVELQWCFNWWEGTLTVPQKLPCDEPQTQMVHIQKGGRGQWTDMTNVHSGNVVKFKYS